MRKQRDGALMILMAGVVVDEFVQLGTRGHRVQQEDKRHQQRGGKRAAEPDFMAIFQLQTICF